MGVVPIVEEGCENVIHRAAWVMVRPGTLIENGGVRVEQGVIRDVSPFRPGGGETVVVDHGDGVLMPGLVNAHTHLELSALNGRLPLGQGFATWVRQLLALREKLGPDRLSEKVPEGAEDLIRSGTLVIGDISTLGLVSPMLAETPLSGVLFREYLGNHMPETVDEEAARRFSASLAGHAPHTTSPYVLKQLKKRCDDRHQPFSIHLAESLDEMEFITTGKGNWAEFLKERTVEYEAWGLPCDSPVAYLDKLGVLDDKTLAVHLIRASAKDIMVLKERRVNVCLCLRSNRNLHGDLPDVESMMRHGLSLCLGTDSLASTESLNVWDDMRFLARSFPQTHPVDILNMATANGARALGLESLYGSLEPGKRAAMVFIPMTVRRKEELWENLIQ